MNLVERRAEDTANLFIKDGILYTVYLPNTTVDLEKAKIMVAEKISICEGMDYPLLVDARFIKGITAEAREYFSNSEDGNAFISAVAILVESNISRMLGNIYLTFNTPRIPNKLFSDKVKAIEWLSQFK